jgi:hypothetical protein
VAQWRNTGLLQRILAAAAGRHDAGAIGEVRHQQAEQQIQAKMIDGEGQFMAIWRWPALAGAAAAAAASLRAMVTAAQAAGCLGNADPGAVVTRLWAFSHGLAQLVIDGFVAPDREAALQLAGSGTIAMLAGHAALKDVPGA